MSSKWVEAEEFETSSNISTSSSVEVGGITTSSTCLVSGTGKSTIKTTNVIKNPYVTSKTSISSVNTSASVKVSSAIPESDPVIIEQSQQPCSTVTVLDSCVKVSSVIAPKVHVTDLVSQVTSVKVSSDIVLKDPPAPRTKVKRLGEFVSANTASRFVTSINLYNLMNDNYSVGRKHFMDLNEEDLEADNIKCILTDYGILLKSKPVPLFWDRKGVWEEQDNPVRLNVNSVMKYFEPLYSILKDAYPEHDYLEGALPQPWWINLKIGTRSVLEKTKMRGEEETFDPKTKAIYIVNDPAFIRFSHNETSMHYAMQTDLRFILHQMMKKATLYGGRQYEYRVVILTTALSVARGGEVKFQRWSDWVYDPRFKVTDICWTEMKQVKKYSMPQVNTNYFDGYEVCFYHAMACYGALEEGFMANNSKAMDFVFGKLHSVNDNTVANIITRKMRDKLSSNLTKKTTISFLF